MNSMGGTTTTTKTMEFGAKQRYGLKTYKPYQPLKGQNYRSFNPSRPIQKKHLRSLREMYTNTRS